MESTKPRKSKKKKALIISLTVVASLAVLYFGGGYAAGFIIHDKIFGHRYDEGEMKRFDETVLLMRKDYPAFVNREEVSFVSNGNTLKGHIYFAPSSKGTILFAHGIYGHRDDNLASLQEYFYSRSYDVFAFDLTASATSEGDGIPGLHQSLFDVKAALGYLATRNDISHNKVATLGYSWGAYGIAAAMEEDLAIVPKAVISFAGFASPFEEMMYMARSRVGVLTEMTAPQLQWSMATRAGSKWNIAAIEGMNTHPEAKWMLIQGDEDGTVPYDVSLYKDALAHAKTFEGFLKRGYGHLGLWRTPEALKAYQDAEDYFKTVQEDKDAYEKLAAYVEEKGGKETFSTLDLSLLEALEKGIESAFNA